MEAHPLAVNGSQQPAPGGTYTILGSYNVNLGMATSKSQPVTVTLSASFSENCCGRPNDGSSIPFETRADKVRTESILENAPATLWASELRGRPTSSGTTRSGRTSARPDRYLPTCALSVQFRAQGVAARS